MDSILPFQTVFSLSLLVVFLNLLVIVKAVSASSYFNIEELQNSAYSVEISDTPLSLEGDELNQFKNGENFIEMVSKVGQRFACHYKVSEEKLKEEPEVDPVSIKIPELLEPMRGNCLVKHKDWWSYKFCFGEEITQFHVHDGRISGDIISLGKFEADKTWNAEDLENLKKSTYNRYHTQQYVNGSVCDLTNKPRRSEVRFSCVEGEADHIGAVAELESCSYIIFIYTSKICYHPYLRPPMKAAPSPITCQPLLSQIAYDAYLANKDAEQSNAEENLADAEDSSSLSLENFDDIKSLLKENFGDVLDLDDLNVEVIDASSADVINDRVKDAISKLSKSSTVEKTSTVAGEKTVPTSRPSNPEKNDERVKGEKAQESLDSYVKKQEKELTKILQDVMESKSVKDTVSKYRENIKNVVSSKFDDIIDEAQREVDASGEGTDDVIKDVAEIKRLMTQYLEEKLDYLEGRSKSSDPDKSSAASVVAQPEPPNDKKKDLKDEDITIQIIKPPKLEVEMVELDSVEEDSDLYHTAQEAREKLSKSDVKTPLKPVIAIVKPLKPRGSRAEEKKQIELEKKYDKLWKSPENQHDEL